MTVIDGFYFESGPIIDRDPGDETPDREQLKQAVERMLETALIVLPARPVLKTYRALYRLGNAYFTRRFQAEDLDHAREQAENAACEDEIVQYVVRHGESELPTPQVG